MYPFVSFQEGIDVVKLVILLFTFYVKVVSSHLQGKVVWESSPSPLVSYRSPMKDLRLLSNLLLRM